MSWNSSRRSSTAARTQPGQDRISYVEKKIQTKDHALAELMTEHVALEKLLVAVGKWKFRVAAGTSARAIGNDNAGSQSRPFSFFFRGQFAFPGLKGGECSA